MRGGPWTAALSGRDDTMRTQSDRDGPVYFSVFGIKVNGEPGEVAAEVVERDGELAILLSVGPHGAELSVADAHKIALALTRAAGDVEKAEAGAFLRLTWGFGDGR